MLKYKACYFSGFVFRMFSKYPGAFMFSCMQQRNSQCNNNNNTNNNNLGAKHPYSQLRAELRRTRLQRVWEAGMQGRLWLPATSTHYDHGAQPRFKVFDFSRGRKTGCSGKPLWHSREPTHNSTHIWPRPGIEPGSPLHTRQPCHPTVQSGAFYMVFSWWFLWEKKKEKIVCASAEMWAHK